MRLNEKGFSVVASWVITSVVGAASGAPLGSLAAPPPAPTGLVSQIKVTFKEALKALKIEAIVQNNPSALPYLSPGKNVITVSVADPKALDQNKLVVTYAYRLGSRTKSFEQLCDEGKEIAQLRLLSRKHRYSFIPIRT